MIDPLNIMHQLLDRAFGSGYQGATGGDIAGIVVEGEQGHRVRVLKYENQVIDLSVDGQVFKAKITVEIISNGK